LGRWTDYHGALREISDRVDGGVSWVLVVVGHESALILHERYELWAGEKMDEWTITRSQSA